GPAVAPPPAGPPEEESSPPRAPSRRVPGQPSVATPPPYGSASYPLPCRLAEAGSTEFCTECGHEPTRPRSPRLPQQCKVHGLEEFRRLRPRDLAGQRVDQGVDGLAVQVGPEGISEAGQEGALGLRQGG